MSSRWRFIIVSLVAVAFLGVAFLFRKPVEAALGFGSPAKHEAKSKDQSRNDNIVDVDPHTRKQLGVQTTAASFGDIVERVHVPGTIAFDERLVTHLKPLTKGRVLSLLVQPGDAVAAGQSLATLDSSGVLDAKNNVQTAEAALAEAKAADLAAAIALKRAQALLKIGGIAEAELERRQVEAVKADAAVQTVQSQLATTKAQYERLAPRDGTAPSASAIVSPIAGVVTTAKVFVGEVVDTTQDAFTVADPRRVLALASVYGAAIQSVKPGDPATVAAPFPGHPDFNGQVRSINADLDPMTNAARARIEVENRGDLLKGNMFVDVTINADLGRRGVMIPASAVQQTEQGSIAFVEKTPTSFERRILRLGLQESDWVEVEDGVRDGEVVATKGSFGLKAILLRSLLGSTD